MRPIPFKVELVRVSPGEPRGPHLENKEPRCECYRVERDHQSLDDNKSELYIGVTRQSKCCKVSLTDTVLKRLR